MDKSTEISVLDDELITHEVVETWSLDSLKDYCRRRGYKVTGAKKELVSRVYFMYNDPDKYPELPDAKQQEASRKKDYRNLFEARETTQDPFKIKVWKNEKEGIANWPPVSYVDIDCFIRQNDSVGLPKEAMVNW